MRSALVAFAFVRFRATRGSAAWAVTSDEPIARKRAPWYALVTPVLPIVLYFAFDVSPIVAFALAAIYGAVATMPRKAVSTLTAALIRGTEDVAPAVILFMGIGMLLVATGLPSVKAALAPLVAAIAPRSWFGYVVLFGLLSPLALYRGPLNPFGVGIAVYTVLAGLGVLPAVTLVAAIMAVVQVQNVCDPTNTQNVWVANFTGVGVDTITKLTLPFQVAVATIATISVVLFGAGLLGVQPFAFGTPASAQTTASNAAAGATAANVRTGPIAPGLFATEASFAVAVVPADASAASELAANEVRRRIEHDAVLRVATAGAPDRAMYSDCRAKPFDAILRVSASDGEVGLTLSDCADWPVEQWYVPRGPDVRADALSAFFRLQTWRVDHPWIAYDLFANGLAFELGDQPKTYFYSLFKTSDGQMRAYVRPGGAAYAAGLRTNDIVSKVDGKYWWEYGTFQTQARAYDGRPHAFVVKRGDRDVEIDLANDAFESCTNEGGACALVPARFPVPARTASQSQAPPVAASLAPR